MLLENQVTIVGIWAKIVRSISLVARGLLTVTKPDRERGLLRERAKDVVCGLDDLKRQNISPSTCTNGYAILQSSYALGFLSISFVALLEWLVCTANWTWAFACPEVRPMTLSQLPVFIALCSRLVAHLAATTLQCRPFRCLVSPSRCRRSTRPPLFATTTSSPTSVRLSDLFFLAIAISKACPIALSSCFQAITRL